MGDSRGHRIGGYTATVGAGEWQGAGGPNRARKDRLGERDPHPPLFCLPPIRKGTPHTLTQTQKLTKNTNVQSSYTPPPFWDPLYLGKNDSKKPPEFPLTAW